MPQAAPLLSAGIASAGPPVAAGVEAGVGSAEPSAAETVVAESEPRGTTEPLSATAEPLLAPQQAPCPAMHQLQRVQAPQQASCPEIHQLQREQAPAVASQPVSESGASRRSHRRRQTVQVFDPTPQTRREQADEQAARMHSLQPYMPNVVVAGGDDLTVDEHQAGNDADQPLADVAQPPAALLAATSEVSASSEPHVYRPVPLFGKDVKLVIPCNHAEAMSSPQSALWKQAEQEEIESLLANGTWDLVQQPAGRVPIGGRWVYSLKCGPQGRVMKFKARWVAKGYSQREGRDYGETFAPTGKHMTVRVYAAIVAEEDLDEVQADVPTAFLNGEIEEELFVQQPEGY
jgi:hypothetical protein